MAKHIYVGNLPWDTTADDLLALFQQYGTVTRAQIIMDKETGRSRGFGFVEMTNDAEAQKAIEALNGFNFRGRPLTVGEARPREDRGGGGGRGYGGGRGRCGGRGGYGGGGGRGGYDILKPPPTGLSGMPGGYGGGGGRGGRGPAASPTAEPRDTDTLPKAIACRTRKRTSTRADADPVDCTVFAPPEAAAGDALLVQVFLHLAGQAEDSKRLAQEFDEESRRLGFRSLEVELSRGTPVVIQLTLPGLEVDNPAQQLTWQGRPASVQFGVTIPGGRQPGTVIGTVVLYLDTLPIGHVKFKVKVKAAAGPTTAPQPLGDASKRYEYAFISYATKDRDEVIKRLQILDRCHIRFFQDVLVLEPGDRWEQKLYEHIDHCDLFLLFWSTAARESEWVQREVPYALDCKGADELQPPEIVPILIEGPPVPAPPPYLAHLHFNDRLLYFLSRPATTPRCN